MYLMFYCILLFEHKGRFKSKENYIGEFKGIKYPNKVHFIITEE